MNEYHTKDGLRIDFEEIIDSEKHIKRIGNRPEAFIVHDIRAHVLGEQVGYLKISYVPAQRFERAFPTVWHFAAYHQGWGFDPNDKAETWKRAHLAMMQHPESCGISPVLLTDEHVPDEKTIDKDLKILERRCNNHLRFQLQQYRRWHVDKPKVDYIKVFEECWRRRGIATAMYLYGARFMAREFNLPLYASTLQRHAARAAWRKIRAMPDAPIRTERTTYYHKRVTRLMLDFTTVSCASNEAVEMMAA